MIILSNNQYYAHFNFLIIWVLIILDLFFIIYLFRLF